MFSSARLLFSALLVLALSTLTSSQGVSVSVGGEESEGVTVDFSFKLQNPCEGIKCEAGSVCVPVVNDLLQLPIGHCEQQHLQNDDGCTSSLSGVSIVSCKTEDEWTDIARSKCKVLRTGSNSATAEVRHPCHRRVSSSTLTFLQALITCCENTQDVIPPTTTTEEEQDEEEEEEWENEMEEEEWEEKMEEEDWEEEEEEEEWEEEEEEEEKQKEEEDKKWNNGLRGSLIAIGTASIVLMVGIAVMVRLVKRRRSRLPYKPKLQLTTSFVNPLATSEVWSGEGWSGDGCKGDDTSLLIFNESLQNTN